MGQKYYYREHIEGYQRVRAEGKTAWAEIHGSTGFENFSSRVFLESVLPRLHFSVPTPAALEYGCGTGPGACFLAGRGFQVDGIDLIPLAIEMAREEARKHNLVIHYAVQDICDLPHGGKTYDLIVDSYCLQGIVTDADRAKVYAAVRARLKPGGMYLISSAVFDEERYRPQETIVDAPSGIVYSRYGEKGIIDAATGIVYVELEGSPGSYEGAIEVCGRWYLPNRRHLKPPALRMELLAAGFTVLYQEGGNLVCGPVGAEGSYG
ncbi:MAG: class I SAM-dependent methyltransferase [Anaerolineae bacterium]|nr:class I SAM-dependent methyltransferase [Anaerolineae bacterium]